MLRAAVLVSLDYVGWAVLGDISSLMVKIYPDFYTRNNGYKKPTDLVTTLNEAFEICHRKSAEGKLIPLYVCER